MNEHDDGSSENPPGNEERDEIGEKRELISSLLEKEKHEELLQLAFTIINERNKKLLNVAVDAVRQVITTHPALVNKSQVQLLVDFLQEEDDILRANAVLALKPIAIHDADHVRDILMQLLELDKSPVCKEEAIRLLAHIGTKFPGKIRELIPTLAKNLEIDGERVAKQSLKALRVISKEYPSQVEKILRNALDTVEESSMLEAIDELLSDIIKRRELKTFDEKKQGRDDEEEEIIPDIPKEGDQVHEELPSGPGELETVDQAQPEMEGEEIHEQEKLKEEIGAQIEEEFSKIESSPSQDKPKLEELKEIKSETDIAPETRSTPEKSKEPPVATDDVHESPETALKPKRMKPVLESSEDIASRQISMKEKALKKREEEIKRLELEKKELELKAKELELQREEMVKAKLEKLEQEIKHKEALLKEKELKMKMQELAVKERELEEKEKNMKNGDTGEDKSE